MREIVTVLGLPDKPIEVDIPKDLVCQFPFCRFLNVNSFPQDITTMSRYKTDFPFSVAFPPQAMTNVLAEWLSKQGVRQSHIAGKRKQNFPFFSTRVLRKKSARSAF